MSIEIIAIGSEVLKGMIINTNGAYLGNRLDEEGWSIARQTTVADDVASLAAVLKESLERSSIVIATGGMGPTLDDNTSFCAKSLFSKPAISLKNTVGLAPGLYFHEKNRHLFLLPGVPSEMEAMFEQEVIPILKQIAPQGKTRHRIKLHFALLKEDDVDPYLRKFQEEWEVEAGIYPSYGSLTVVLEGQKFENLEKAYAQLKKQFQSHYYESTSGKLEEAIQNWMVKHQQTLVCAESCTGGFLSAQLTSVPGASRYFLGSVVAYSNELKEKFLHVPSTILKTKGAVSRETAHEMWKGVLQKTGADFGAAVTGIAGPTGATAEKPVGTVEYAIGFKNQPPEVGTLHFNGNRQVVILRTTRRILGLIWQKLSQL